MSCRVCGGLCHNHYESEIRDHYDWSLMQIKLLLQTLIPICLTSWHSFIGFDMARAYELARGTSRGFICTVTNDLTLLLIYTWNPSNIYKRQTYLDKNVLSCKRLEDRSRLTTGRKLYWYISSLNILEAFLTIHCWGILASEFSRTLQGLLILIVKCQRSRGVTNLPGGT